MYIFNKKAVKKSIKGKKKSLIRCFHCIKPMLSYGAPETGLEPAWVASLDP